MAGEVHGFMDGSYKEITLIGLADKTNVVILSLMSVSPSRLAKRISHRSLVHKVDPALFQRIVPVSRLVEYMPLFLAQHLYEILTVGIVPYTESERIILIDRIAAGEAIDIEPAAQA